MSGDNSGERGDVLTFLSSPETLGTKTFHPGPGGVESIDYSMPAGPFHVTRVPVADLEDASRYLLACPPQAFMVRGMSPHAAIPYRRHKAHPGELPSLAAEAHRLLPIDWDDPETCGLPPCTDIYTAAVQIRGSLPGEFHAARCLAVGSSSAGRKPGRRVRLWFWCSRPVADAEAKAWLDGYGTDLGIYTPSQPIYVATPRFDGVPDFLAGVPRSVWLDGGEIQVPEIAARTRAPKVAGLAPGAYTTTPVQGRNVALTSIAGAMRRKGVGEDAILAALSAHNETFPEPLPDDEVEKIAASIAGYEPEAPRTVALQTNPAKAEKEVRKQAERLSTDPAGLLADVTARVAMHVRSGAVTEMQAVTILARAVDRSPLAHTLGRDDIAAAIAQAPIALPETRDLPHWTAGCILSEEGNPISCPENLRLVLAQHPGISLWWNSRSQQDHWQACPWHPPGPVLPTDDFALRAFLSRELGWHKAPAEPLAAIAEVARQRPYDPWRAWLDSLQWDGKRRLAKAAPVLLGTDSTPRSRLCFAWWMLSAVARSYVPGCQVDHAIVLEGAQGGGKTSFLRKLAMDEQFFTRLVTAGDLHSPRAIGRIHGPVLVEIAELAALKRQDVEAVKAYIDECFDRVQWLYSKKPVDVGRTCVFAPTTNDGEYLRDITGARRWWPLACTNIRLDVLDAVKEQLWAEAVYLYKRGVKWYPRSTWQAQRLGLSAAQEQRREKEIGEDRLSEILNEVRTPGRNPLTGVTIEPAMLDHAGRIVAITTTLAAEMCGLHPARDGKALTRTFRALGWQKIGQRWTAPDLAQRGTWVSRAEAMN